MQDQFRQRWSPSSVPPTANTSPATIPSALSSLSPADGSAVGASSTAVSNISTSDAEKDNMLVQLFRRKFTRRTDCDRCKVAFEDKEARKKYTTEGGANRNKKWDSITCCPELSHSIDGTDKGPLGDLVATVWCEHKSNRSFKCQKIEKLLAACGGLTPLGMEKNGFKVRMRVNGKTFEKPILRRIPGFCTRDEGASFSAPPPLANATDQQQSSALVLQPSPPQASFALNLGVPGAGASPMIDGTQLLLQVASSQQPLPTLDAGGYGVATQELTGTKRSRDETELGADDLEGLLRKAGAEAHLETLIQQRYTPQRLRKALDKRGTVSVTTSLVACELPRGDAEAIVDAL